MSLTAYVRNILKPSPSEYRQRFEAAEALAALPEEPSLEMIKQAQSVIDDVIRQASTGKGPRRNDIHVMQVPGCDFTSTPHINSGCAPRSQLKDNTVAAVVYDFFAEAGLNPYLSPWTTQSKSGTVLALHEGRDSP